MIIDHLVDDIEMALKHDMWTIALTASLALPDICSALASDSGQSTGAKYRAWFTSELGSSYGRLLSAADAWQLRCSILHQGRSTPKGYSRVIFTTPVPGLLMHNNVINDALQIEIPTFCRDICDAARIWYAAHAGDANVKRNSADLMRWYPGGLPPYIGGIPVLS